MLSEPAAGTFCPALEIKGLFPLLMRGRERKAGRESGARVGSVALVSSCEGTPSLQKGQKTGMYVTCGCNTRQEQASFSTSLHQRLTLETNYTARDLSLPNGRVNIPECTFTKHSLCQNTLAVVCTSSAEQQASQELPHLMHPKRFG